MGLTLIKSGTYPNENADIGFHEFTYSIIPTRRWQEAEPWKWPMTEFAPGIRPGARQRSRRVLEHGVRGPAGLFCGNDEKGGEWEWIYPAYL